MKKSYLILAVLILLSATGSRAQAVNDYSAIHAGSRAITGWATKCVVLRGPQNIASPSSGAATFGEDADALGPADNAVVSLGDGGIAILSFGEAISNKPGPDFAVFENSFDGKYLELAFVEVSSDSIRWVRFPAISDVQTATQTDAFGNTDPAAIHNLAGKYPVYYGTPFFLEDIADSAGIDIGNINYIRIVDVVGSLDEDFASRDSRGVVINDPWPTPFPQSGFDLDAVAITDISFLSVEDVIAASITIYPNPVYAGLTIGMGEYEAGSIRILDLKGGCVMELYCGGNSCVLDFGGLAPGLYIAEIEIKGRSLPVYRKILRL